MLSELFNNEIFISIMIAWMLAQLIKVLLDKIMHNRVDFTRIVGAGGMPSSHSSFVTALATSIACREGMASTEFALALALAGIVMYDAAGVRRSAGKQAEILNKIVDDLYSKDHKIKKERLKELIGHSPIEVFAGALLGIAVALYIC